MAKNTTNTSAADNTDDFFPGLNSGVEQNTAETIIDFDSVSEGGFEPLPVGTYSANIGTMEMRTSKNGNPMLSITFNIVHPDFPKRKLFSHYVLNNDIALGRLKKFLLNVFPDISLSNLNLSALCAAGTGIGRACELKVIQRPYDGRMTNDVKDVLPPSDMSLL